MSDAITDKEIDQARQGLLGLSNMLSDSNAALLRQSEAMLRYFQLTRKKAELERKPVSEMTSKEFYDSCPAAGTDPACDD